MRGLNGIVLFYDEELESMIIETIAESLRFASTRQTNLTGEDEV